MLDSVGRVEVRRASIKSVDEMLAVEGVETEVKVEDNFVVAAVLVVVAAVVVMSVNVMTLDSVVVTVFGVP